MVTPPSSFLTGYHFPPLGCDPVLAVTQPWLRGHRLQTAASLPRPQSPRLQNGKQGALYAPPPTHTLLPGLGSNTGSCHPVLFTQENTEVHARNISRCCHYHRTLARDIISLEHKEPGSCGTEPCAGQLCCAGKQGGGVGGILAL